MSFKPAHLIAGGLLVVAALSGCVGRYQSSFSVVVENRLAVNAIQLLANGNDMGQVAAGKTASFSLQLPESNANVFTNGVAPTPQAEVTLTAKDLKTGALSTDKSLTLSQSSPAHVTFSAADFPSSVPTIARMVISPTNPTINQDINFNASTSTGSNLTFAWDFGDGQTGTGILTTHQYSRAGTQRVVLTVTSDSGQTNSTSNSVTVSAAAPQINVNFTFSPTTPAINQDVLFTVSGTGVTGATFAWDFGDGATATSSGTTVTHRYTRAGTFTVTLRVNGSVSQPATRSVPVTATPVGTVNFTISPTAAGVNDTIFFNASLTTVANATFRWDFGDGSSGSGQTTTHQYSRAATYSVTLTVTNDLGQSASISKTIIISATSAQLVANFTFSPATPSVNDTVFFNASSSTGATAFTWDFGDGSSGSGVTPTHQYSRGGTYTVTLTVVNNAGQSAATSKTVTVSATSTQLVANFTFSPTTPSVNDTVFFNASSSTGATAFTWDFGDGSSGSGVTPTHQYSRGGTYTVTLTAANNVGQSATTSKTVTVSAAQIVADFTFSPTDPSISKGTNTVIFDATPSSVGVTTWAWDFGDGSTPASGQKPSHKFLLQGTWVVRLTVTDSAGRTATTTKNVTVAP